ncbi:MAG: gliding motility-associated C-terminal domain-containing protein [Bacteroidia bacterium]
MVNSIDSCSYEWNLGNGWANGSKSAVAFYSNPGTIDISLRITLPDGSVCTVNESEMITVRAKPIAQIDALTFKLCNGPGELEFTDNTINSVSRNWIIDGTNYNNANSTIKHKFTSIGSKSISLIVTDSFGCQGVAQYIDTIQVYKEEKIDFEADINRGCIPQNVQLSVVKNSEPEFDPSYTWYLEGTSQDSIEAKKPGKLTYNTVGKFDVSLSVSLSNGCTYDIEKEDFLMFGEPIDLNLKFGNTKVCKNSPISLKLNNGASVGVNSWKFSGIDLSYKEISSTKYEIYPQESGTLQVTVKNANKGCVNSETFTKEIEVKSVKAAFNSEDNFHCLVPHTVHLNNTSQKKDADSLEYTWNIYRGDTLVHTASTKDDSMTFYQMPASYDVQLIAIGNNGCIDTVFKKNFIYQDTMDVRFKAVPDIGCIGQEIVFLNNTKASTYMEEDLFNWTFYDLDGSVLDTSSLRDPILSYSDTGIYSVRLIGYNSLECRDTLEFDAVQIIDPELKYELSDSIICLGESINAKSLTSPMVNTMTHSWTLTHQLSGVSKEYEGVTVDFTPWDAGQYTLSYTFQIEEACLHQKDINIYVNGIDGEILVDSMQACSPFILVPSFNSTYNYHFGNSSQSVDYTWTVDPSSGANINNPKLDEPSISFTKDGFYSLTLTVENSSLCSSTVELTDIQVGVIAKLDIIDNAICLGDTLRAKNHSQNANTLYSYNVKDYIDFNTYNLGDNEGILMQDSGHYILELIAEKDGLCSDTASSPFEIIQVVADFVSNDTFLKCAPVYVQFQNQSVNYDSLFWDFGDGKTSATTENSAGTIYEKNTSGSDGFDVQLIASNKEGCKDTLIKDDYVIVSGPKPKFSMKDYTACHSTEVTFINETQGADYMVIDFVDGSPLDSSLSSHTYEKLTDDMVETFYPRLYASDDNGCVAEYISDVPVTLYKNPTAQFELPDLTSACAPQSIQVENKTAQVNQQLWYLDGEFMSDKKLLDLSMNEFGNFELGLYTENKYGCSDSLYKTFDIHGIPDFSIAMDDTICLYKNINFEAQIQEDDFIDIADINISWNFGETGKAGNIVVGQQHAQFAYTESGDKKVTLYLNTTAGCYDSTTVEFNLRGSDELDQPEVNYLTFNQGYDLELNHETTNDAHFAAYRFERSDGLTYLSSDQNKHSWTNSFVSKPDSALCYDLNIQDNCGLDGPKSRSHCFIYLSVSSTQNFNNQLDWTPYKGWNKVAQYHIFRRENSTNAYSLIATVSGTVNSYIDEGLCDKEYEYYVQAENNSNTDKSNSFAVIHRPATSLNTIKSSIANASVINEYEIEVKWNSSQFEHFDHYVLNKYESNTSNLVSSTELYDTTFIDYDVFTSENSYIYTVQEVDGCGMINDPDRIGKTMLLEASYDNLNHQSTLNWSAYEEWENGVQEYLISLYSEEGDQFLGAVSPTTTTFVDEEYHVTLNGSYCYRILAVNDKGDTSISNIACIQGDPISYIPNAFSPNGDGLNDRFRPISRFVDHEADVIGFRMEIYNSWGELLFRTDDLISGWDGSYKGSTCQQGAYIYLIDYKGVNGKRYNHKGSLTLMR